jgi:hypothetical protein
MDYLPIGDECEPLHRLLVGSSQHGPVHFRGCRLVGYSRPFQAEVDGRTRVARWAYYR